MPPKLAQVALDVQFLYQPLQIILYNFAGLVQLFESLQTRRQLNQFVTQALPLIARTCTDICGAAYYAPRLTAAARALVQDMEWQLGLAPGDRVSGIAEWLVGSPPISLLLEEFLVPGAVIGIFRQGTGPHFRMNLRQGLPALQVPYTLLHLVGPPSRTNGRSERIFVHNPNPVRHPPRPGHPPLTQQQAQVFPIRQTSQHQRRARSSNNKQASPRNPPPNYAPPGHAGSGVVTRYVSL